MKEIELVIKIPVETYEYWKEHSYEYVLAEAIKNGTVLPKGHGRLIDVDDLDITTITTDDYSGNEVLDIVLQEDIDDALTIIEADKEKI